MKSIIDDYNKMAVASRQKIKADKRDIGAWAPACVQHGFLQNDKYIQNQNYRIPTQVGVEIKQAILNFMDNKEKIYIDSVGWPNNEGCNGRRKKTYLRTS